MFEVLILALSCLGLFFIEPFWLGVVIFILGLIVVVPGVYAMISGAPFLVSPPKRIDRIIELADLRVGDRVVELGCGDGRIIRRISEIGVKSAIGYEYSVPTYLFARAKSFFGGKGERIVFGNFWNEDFSNVDVFVCYLFDSAMEKFEKEVWPGLSAGVRVVSSEFKMPTVPVKRHENGVFLYEKTD